MFVGRIGEMRIRLGKGPFGRDVPIPPHDAQVVDPERLSDDLADETSESVEASTERIVAEGVVLVAVRDPDVEVPAMPAPGRSQLVSGLDGQSRGEECHDRDRSAKATSPPTPD